MYTKYVQQKHQHYKERAFINQVYQESKEKSPNAFTHSKRECKIGDAVQESRIDFSQPSKVQAFISLHRPQHQAMRNHTPNNSITQPSKTARPASSQLLHSTQHHPSNPKHGENQTPQLLGNGEEDDQQSLHPLYTYNTNQLPPTAVSGAYQPFILLVYILYC